MAGRTRARAEPIDLAAAAGCTVELPLGHAQRRALTGAIRSTGALHVVVIAAAILALLLLGLGLRHTAPESSSAGFDPVVALGIAGAVVGVATAVGGWRRVARLRKDRAQGSFLRTTGVARLRSAGTMVFMEFTDRSFPIALRIARKVPTPFAGTVDHSPYAHLVFEVRSADGTLLFRDGGDGPSQAAAAGIAE